MYLHGQAPQYPLIGRIHGAIVATIIAGAIVAVTVAATIAPCIHPITCVVDLPGRRSLRVISRLYIW